MIYDNLLEYSSIFLKEAGLLKVPENLLQEVQDWALSVYFTKIISIFLYYRNLFSENEFKEKLIECKRFVKENIKMPQDQLIEFKFFEFVSPIDQSNERILVNFFLEKSKDRSGSFKKPNASIGRNEPMIQINYKPLPDDNFELKAEAIKKTIRHELQHLMQYLIAEKNLLKEEKEIRHDNTYSIFYPALLKKPLRDWKYFPKKDEHAHLSIEYHTRIADSIDNFKLVINTIPKQIHNLFLDCWISKNMDLKQFFAKLIDFNIPNLHFINSPIENEKIFFSKFKPAYLMLKKNSEMFAAYQRYNFEKYKLAVKEFYKEVQDLL